MRACFGCLLAVALGMTAIHGASARAAEEDFFRPATDRAAALPADRPFPQGRLFPFSFYSVPDKDMQRLKDHAVPLAGPQYGGSDPRVAAEAGKLGLKVIYSVAPKYTLEEIQSGKLTDEQIGASVREQVAAVSDSDTIAWWYVQPEELRHWRAPELRYLEVAARAVRETDPKRRPVWMYDPGHRNDRALQETARHLDIVGKGMYTNYSGMKDSRVWCRWSIEQEVMAIAAANPKAIPIAVPEMFQQPAPEDLALIPAWVRHDVYAALTAGAKGVVVFSASHRRDFAAREVYFQSYLDVARELCGEMNLGQVVLFGERRKDLQVDVITGPQTVSMVFPSGGVKDPIKYPAVGVLNVAWGTDRYLFLVNSANEPVEAIVVGLPYGRIMVGDFLSDAKPFVAPEGEFPVDLPPLGVKVFRIHRDMPDVAQAGERAP